MCVFYSGLVEPDILIILLFDHMGSNPMWGIHTTTEPHPHPFSAFLLDSLLSFIAVVAITRVTHTCLWTLPGPFMRMTELTCMFTRIVVLAATHAHLFYFSQVFYWGTEICRNLHNRVSGTQCSNVNPSFSVKMSTSLHQCHWVPFQYPPPSACLLDRHFNFSTL